MIEDMASDNYIKEELHFYFRRGKQGWRRTRKNSLLLFQNVYHFVFEKNCFLSIQLMQKHLRREIHLHLLSLLIEYFLHVQLYIVHRKAKAFYLFCQYQRLL